MNHLLAALNSKDNKIWRIMSDEQDFYKIPDLDLVSDYSPDYQLEEGEWYRLDKFKSLHFTCRVIDTSFSMLDYLQLEKKNYNKINYLACQQGDYCIFQRCYPSQIIKKKYLRKL